MTIFYQIKINKITKKAKDNFTKISEMLSKMNVDNKRVKFFFITSNKEISCKNHIYMDTNVLDEDNLKKIVKLLNLKIDIKKFVMNSIISFFKELLSLDTVSNKNYYFDNYEDISSVNILSQDILLKSKYKFKFFNKEIVIKKLMNKLKNNELIDLNVEIESVEDISKYLNRKY